MDSDQLVAAAAGLVSFFSPCVVPLLPGYLSYATGLSGADLESAKRGRMALGAVVGVLVTVLVLAGAAAFYVLRDGEARSPSEVADLFGQAKVSCLDFDVITDERATKTLGCRTDDVQIITVTTYGNIPDGDEWLTDKCEASEGSAARLRRGYYLRGDDFIVDMHQLTKDPEHVLHRVSSTASSIVVAAGGSWSRVETGASTRSWLLCTGARSCPRR